MAHPDHQLARLEEVLRLARERLAGIIRMVPDPAAIKAAEDLCAEAVASIGVHKAKQAYERKHLISVSYRLWRPAKCLA